MTRYSIAAAVLACAALVAGCGEEKQLPTDVQQPESSVGQSQAVPARSDPEAKAAVERAVKALTGGRPELLAKGKNCRCVLKGQMTVGQPDQFHEANRTVATVWPDRFHSANERLPGGGRVVDEAWLRRPDLVVVSNGEVQPLPNVDLFERYLAADVVGQNWMPLLLPATDPKAVVFDHLPVAEQGRARALVKLSLGEFPLYQLAFDAKTGALVRVEYTTSLGNVSRRVAMTFTDHTPGPDGLVLPHGIECRHNNNLVEKWTVEKWEFPASIGDEQFSPPAKK